MTKRGVPRIPARPPRTSTVQGLPVRQIGIALIVVLVALVAIVTLKQEPAPTPAGTVPIELDGSGGGLGQLEPSQSGGVDGPAPTGLEGPSENGVEGPPSLDVEAWHELFQGEIQ